MQCNYRVTNDDRAWNNFLKQSLLYFDYIRKIDMNTNIPILAGHVLEYGQFQSVRSRLGTKWSSHAREMYQRKRKAAKNNFDKPRLKTIACLPKKSIENHRAELSAAIQTLIDLTERPMPKKYLQRQDMSVVLSHTIQDPYAKDERFFSFLVLDLSDKPSHFPIIYSMKTVPRSCPFHGVYPIPLVFIRCLSGVETQIN